MKKPVLALLACLASLVVRVHSQGPLADIIYVNDQSGSMTCRYVWISPDDADTVYLNDGCPGYYTSADLNNHGHVIIPYESGTRAVSRVNPAKSPTNCTAYLSGDPFGQRAIAFRHAVDFQAGRAPESRAGYLGFSNGLLGAISPRQLNTAANISALKANITLRTENSTNYLVALDQAKKWLADPFLSPNPAKAVVFLSDGRPTAPDLNSHLGVLSANYPSAPGIMPPIYGIFLGSPTPDTAKLQELSLMTGGRFFLVPPDRPDSLRAAMERIIGIILEQPTRIRMARSPGTPRIQTRKGMPFGSVFADLLGRLRKAKEN